ncbi:hypothetical protein BC829DRAFT_390416 [Chytridium lagenaria]|nr:hypothetical protein BC829DRAFT_390416 [Chytridium lagenaria]
MLSSWESLDSPHTPPKNAFYLLDSLNAPNLHSFPKESPLKPQPNLACTFRLSALRKLSTHLKSLNAVLKSIETTTHQIHVQDSSFLSLLCNMVKDFVAVGQYIQIHSQDLFEGKGLLARYFAMQEISRSFHSLLSTMTTIADIIHHGHSLKTIEDRVLTLLQRSDVLASFTHERRQPSEFLSLNHYTTELHTLLLTHVAETLNRVLGFTGTHTIENSHVSFHLTTAYQFLQPSQPFIGVPQESSWIPNTIMAETSALSGNVRRDARRFLGYLEKKLPEDVVFCDFDLRVFLLLVCFFLTVVRSMSMFYVENGKWEAGFRAHIADMERTQREKNVERVCFVSFNEVIVYAPFMFFFSNVSWLKHDPVNVLNARIP